MRKTWIALALAAGLLAGCGGGEPAEPKASPTPERTYTLEELKAALPGTEDVPGALEVVTRCPEDGDDCGDRDDAGEASIVVSVEGGTAADSEVGMRGGYNFVAVTVAIGEPDALDAELAQIRANVEKTTGEFDEPEQKLEKFTVAAKKGTRTLTDVESGPFDGFSKDERFTDADAGPVLEVVEQVVGGNARIIVQATLGGTGREDDAAVKLADRLLEEYLERLG